jgi:hypothetical protein
MVSSYEALYLDRLEHRGRPAEQPRAHASLGGVLAAGHLWSRLWR